MAEARDDWREVLELARAIQQRAGAEAVARTLEKISAWTGDTGA